VAVTAAFANCSRTLQPTVATPMACSSAAATRCLLAEAYYTGTDKPGGAWFSRTVTFDAETLHDLRSISKSVVGLGSKGNAVQWVVFTGIGA
jgi:hypothetical protein